MKNLCVHLTLLSLLPFSTGRALALDIVRGGKAATAIVTPEEPLPVVALAAEELQHHVQKATGVKLSIHRESEKPAGFAGFIYVGECRATTEAGLVREKLPTNAFMIKLVDGNLHLYGDDEHPTGTVVEAFNKTAHIGTLSAVYEFLEEKLGVRWLWPGELGEYVPTCRNLSVAKWDREYRHRFAETWLGLSALRRGKGQWSSEAAAEAHAKATRLWSRRHRFSLVENISGCHAYHGYWKRFGKTHPEYFALLPNGKRETIPGDKTGHYITMCVSQPALWKQTIRDWREQKYPPWSWQRMNGLKYLPCGDNDAPGMCLCAQCRAWDAPDPRFKTSPYWTGNVMPGFHLAGRGIYPASEREREPSLSDRYAKFYLAIHGEAAKANPDVIVTGSAYVNYADPPKQTKLHDHICISIVPPGIYPQTEETGRRFREQWQGWRDTGAVLKLRPNITHAGHNMPVSYTHWLYRNFTFAAERGMIATSWDSLLGEYATQGPTLYLLARLHVRPDMSLDEILGEYYAAFGPAGDAVKAYFDYWEKVSGSVTQEAFARYREEEGGGDHRNWLRVADRIFTPEVMARGRELLEAAKATEGLSGVEERRVVFLDDGLKHAELTLAALRASKEFKASGKADDKFAAGAALRELFAFRKSVDSTHISNMGYLAYRETQSWEASLARVRKEDKVLAGVWKFCFDPSETGQQEGWHGMAYDDSGWDDIGVDSCWEKQVPGAQWRQKHGKDFDGIAWYRTRFSLRAEDAGKRVRLTFGAVDEACIIYLNGDKVHTRVFDKVNNPGGWNQSFSIDVTDHVNRRGKNTLAVRVEDRAGAGGVWKPVYLAVGR